VYSHETFYFIAPPGTFPEDFRMSMFTREWRNAIVKYEEMLFPSMQSARVRWEHAADSAAMAAMSTAAAAPAEEEDTETPAAKRQCTVPKVPSATTQMQSYWESPEACHLFCP
jgi:hypothetical protein